VWLVSGQVGHLLPDALTEAIADPEAMMQMGKIDIAAIEAAHRGRKPFEGATNDKATRWGGLVFIGCQPVRDRDYLA
jgi:hypothetical protein